MYGTLTYLLHLVGDGMGTSFILQTVLVPQEGISNFVNKMYPSQIQDIVEGNWEQICCENSYEVSSNCQLSH
jgi:hypothetical protein